MSQGERRVSSDTSMLVEILAVTTFSTLFHLVGGTASSRSSRTTGWIRLLSPALFAWALRDRKLCPGTECSFVAGIGYFGGIPRRYSLLVGISVPTVLGASLAAHWYDNLRHYIALFMPASGFVIGDDANRRQGSLKASRLTRLSICLSDLLF